MNINFVEGICPNCGAKTKEPCNTWVYGSPIKTCRSCNSEYIDNRFKEVAIDGFDARSSNPKLYLIMTIVFLVVAIICTFVLSVFISNDRAFPVALIGCIIIAYFGTILCGIFYLRIKLGYEDKNKEKQLAESKERLMDKSYVSKLIDYGYNIPDEYL